MSTVGVIQDGPLVVAGGIAAFAGVVGFLSPCVLPLVPGYLAYVAGLSGQGDARPRRMVVGAGLFVGGFSAVLVGQGVAFGAWGSTLTSHSVGIARILGVITIAMGIVFLGGFGLLQREVRFHRLPRPGFVGAPLLGAAFGLAWTPCMTPTFGTVYAMAFQQGTAWRGALLSACYCAGLGVPFVLVALGFGWVTKALTFVRAHRGAVSAVGGGFLIMFGLLMVSGEWNHWMDTLRSEVGPGGIDI